MRKGYAKYFGNLVKERGQPNLSDNQYRRMMNIVFLDGMLAGIDDIRKPLAGTREAHKYDMDYFRIDRKLTEITGNLEPRALLDEMLNLDNR
jgi:hypothetical protein